MNPEKIKNTIQAITDGLTPLAQKMQVPLEKLFALAIKENMVTAIIEIFFVAVFLAAVIAYILLIKWFGKEPKEGGETYKTNYEKINDDEGAVPMGVIVFGIAILLFGVVIIFWTIPDIIARLVNPEYHALEDILNQAK